MSLISVATLVVIIVAGLTAPAPASSDPRIKVAPLEYDFGDVGVGTTSTSIITISNVAGEGLTV